MRAWAEGVVSAKARGSAGLDWGERCGERERDPHRKCFGNRINKICCG